MKKNKKRLFYLVVLCLITLLLYLFLSSVGYLFQEKSKKIIVNNPKRILITDGVSTSSAEILNNSWFSSGYPADYEKINNLIKKTTILEDFIIVSTRKEKIADFGINEKKYIQIDDTKLFIGNRYGSVGNYIVINGVNFIYGIKTDFDEFFYPIDFRDLSPKIIESEQNVNEISIQHDLGKFLLTKKNSEWYINGEKSEKANREKVVFFINDIKTIRATDIQKIENINTATMSSKAKIDINENNKNSSINFYQPNENTLYLIKQNSKYAHTVEPSVLLLLQKTKDDFMMVNNERTLSE